MKTYRHIFFDLDRTLWDYDQNSTEALQEIYELYQLDAIYNSFAAFHTVFERYNDQLWDDFRNGKVHKIELRTLRFEWALKDYGVVNPELAAELNQRFLQLSPRKTKLLPGTIETLEYLKSKKYFMYIITNGFTHIQRQKVDSSGLAPYFIRMFTSDNACSHKPHKDMFTRAITWANARKVDALMVGDDLKVDILGAKNFGMDQVFYNHQNLVHTEQVTYEIRDLRELLYLL